MPKQESNKWLFSAVYYGDESKQELVHKVCKTVAKKFIYQLERGEEKGKLHYQMYLNVKKKTRPKALGALMSGLGLLGIDPRYCSEKGEAALKSYCMKSDTRVAGPWADKYIYRGQDLITELRPWQQEIFDMIQTDPDKRKIYWYTDSKGGAGKTSFAKWLYYHHDILCLTFADAKDLLNVVYNRQGLKCYLFDLSRTKGGKTSMSDIYQALESVKNGYFINSKYETGVACYAVPHVIVFSNHEPDRNCLSLDRWCIKNM